MLRGRFKGLSREFQGYFKEVKEVSGCFESFSRKLYQKSFKDFDVVVVVVLHSSQLPEQKEGLFYHK